MTVRRDWQRRKGSRGITTERLLRLHDDRLIESVLMPYADNRRTACISSQVGCAMGCTFCATGQMGFSRDLTEAEIFEQAARFAAELRERELELHRREQALSSGLQAGAAAPVPAT